MVIPPLPHPAAHSPLPEDDNSQSNIALDESPHDVTGGMGAKLQCAIDIVHEFGVDVYIVQAATPHAKRVMRGENIQMGKCHMICDGQESANNECGSDPNNSSVDQGGENSQEKWIGTKITRL
jgi:glutamate 5-kinase